MAKKIDIKDIEKLAALSRLSIADDEKASLAKEIDSILGYVEQIKDASASLQIDEQVPAHHNVMREDANPHESGIYTEKILEESPDRDGQYIKVKKILG